MAFGPNGTSIRYKYGVVGKVGGLNPMSTLPSHKNTTKISYHVSRKSYPFLRALLLKQCFLEKDLPWNFEAGAYKIDPFIDELVHILNLDSFGQMEPLRGDQNEQYEFYFFQLKMPKRCNLSTWNVNIDQGTQNFASIHSRKQNV